jgi:hypothetical protein
MISAIIADLKRDLAQAILAGEPDNWNLSVSKADVREMIEVLSFERPVQSEPGGAILGSQVHGYVAT